MISIKYTNGELIQIEKGWNNLPNKPILRVKITIDNHVLMMEGYEEYNHLQEYCMNISNGIQNIRNRFLLGRIGNMVKGIKYNYITDKIEKFETEFGSEYYGRPSTGWKEGVKEGNIEYFYF
jgi:hypothetical protein